MILTVSPPFYVQPHVHRNAINLKTAKKIGHQDSENLKSSSAATTTVAPPAVFTTLSTHQMNFDAPSPKKRASRKRRENPDEFAGMTASSPVQKPRRDNKRGVGTASSKPAPIPSMRIAQAVTFQPAPDGADIISNIRDIIHVPEIGQVIESRQARIETVFSAFPHKAANWISLIQQQFPLDMFYNTTAPTVNTGQAASLLTNHSSSSMLSSVTSSSSQSGFGVTQKALYAHLLQAGLMTLIYTFEDMRIRIEKASLVLEVTHKEFEQWKRERRQNLLQQRNRDITRDYESALEMLATITTTLVAEESREEATNERYVLSSTPDVATEHEVGASSYASNQVASASSAARFQEAAVCSLFAIWDEAKELIDSVMRKAMLLMKDYLEDTCALSDFLESISNDIALFSSEGERVAIMAQVARCEEKIALDLHKRHYISEEWHTAVYRANRNIQTFQMLQTTLLNMAINTLGTSTPSLSNINNNSNVSGSSKNSHSNSNRTTDYGRILRTILTPPSFYEQSMRNSGNAVPFLDNRSGLKLSSHGTNERVSACDWASIMENHKETFSRLFARNTLSLEQFQEYVCDIGVVYTLVEVYYNRAFFDIFSSVL